MGRSNERRDGRGACVDDWRRQYLNHGNGKKKTWSCTEISYVCLPFGASVAVQTNHIKHLRLAECMTVHTVFELHGGRCVLANMCVNAVLHWTDWICRPLRTGHMLSLLNHQ